MRLLERILLVAGIVCLGLYGFFKVEAYWHQRELEIAFDRELEIGATNESEPTYEPAPDAPAPVGITPNLKEGDLVGRLEVPRLDLFVMVMEGTADKTLRLGAGHIPGTALPGTTGNVAIAAHRDTFFRSLKDVKKDDAIRFRTTHGVIKYRVTTTKVVNPSDTEVLEPQVGDMLTLVTCYPFYYVGPAPKRFIVQAIRAD